jgi:hypothetical protein
MDQLVRELNRLGYQPVFLPRTNIEPPELYSYSPKAGGLVRRGPLKDHLADAADLAVETGHLGNISYSYTSTKKAKAATSFLQESLKCIGIDAIPKIELGFTGSQDFSFAFTDVTYHKVDSTKIEKIVQGISTTGIPKELIDEKRLHIAFEYAYANELLMSRGDMKDFSENISGKVGDFIDVGVKGSVELKSKSTISFKGKGKQRAAFAYKAGYLSREDDQWEFHTEEIHRAAEPVSLWVPQPGVVLSVKHLDKP